MKFQFGRGKRSLTLPALMVSIPFSFSHEASVAPFLNEIAAELDLSTGITGQLGTTTYLGGIGAALMLAPFIGQLAIRRVLVLALMTVGLTSVISGFVEDFSLLLVIRLVTGVAAGIVLAASLAAVPRAWTDPETRVVRTGLVIGAMALGPGVLAPALRGVAALTDWQFGLVIYGVTTSAVAIFVAIGLPSLPGQPSDFSYRSRLVDASRSVTMPVVKLVLGVRLISQIIFGLLFAFLAAFFIDIHPGKEAWIAPLFFVGPFGFMLAAFVCGPLMSKFGIGLVTVLATILTSVSMIGFVWLAPSPYLSAFFFFMYGLLTGVAQTGMTALIYEYSGKRLDAAVFVNSALGPGGSMIGALLGGVVLVSTPGYDGYKGLMTVVSLAAVFASLVLLVGTRRESDTDRFEEST